MIFDLFASPWFWAGGCAVFVGAIVAGLAKAAIKRKKKLLLVIPFAGSLAIAAAAMTIVFYRGGGWPPSGVFWTAGGVVLLSAIGCYFPRGAGVPLGLVLFAWLVVLSAGFRGYQPLKSDIPLATFHLASYADGALRVIDSGTGAPVLLSQREGLFGVSVYLLKWEPATLFVPHLEYFLLHSGEETSRYGLFTPFDLLLNFGLLKMTSIDVFFSNPVLLEEYGLFYSDFEGEGQFRLTQLP